MRSGQRSIVASSFSIINPTLSCPANQTMRYFLCLLFVVLLGISPRLTLGDALPEKVTYDDHIKPIFREHCLSCHNSNDKKSGLALDTYVACIAGGSGGECLIEGDIDSSRLWALTAHVEQPTMPPNQDKIADPKLALIKRWIEQGMPENTGSTIKKPKVNLAAMGTVTAGRPDGPPPMPETALKQTTLFTERAASIAALAASPWSPLVAVGGQNQVVLYHTETGELLGVLPFPEGEPHSITFSRDGRSVLVGGGKHSHSGYAVLYDIKTGNRITRVGDELDIVLASDLTTTGQLLHELKRHTDWIYALRFSPDGLLLATGDRSNGLFVWETDTGRFYLDLLGHKNEIRSLAWRPDSSALISGSMDGTIKLWEMVEGKVTKSWDAHGGGVNAVASCNDGTIVSTGKDQQVKVWDVSGNAAGAMPALAEQGLEVAVSVDSKYVIAGDWAGNVRVWERAKPTNEKQLRSNPLTLQMMIASAEQSVGEAKKLADQAKSDSDAKQAQVTTLQTELSKVEAEIVAMSAKIESIQSQTNQEKVASERDTALITQLKQAIAADQAIADEKAKLIAASKEAQSDVVALESERNSLVKKLTDQQTLVTSADQQQALRKKSIETLATQSADLAAQKVTKQASITDMQAKLKILSEAHAAARAKTDAAANQLATATSVLEKNKSSLVAFETAMNGWKQKRATLQSQSQQLAAAKAKSQSEADVKQATYTSIVTKIAGLQKQIDELKQLVDSESQVRTTTEAELNAQKGAIQALQNQIDQAAFDDKSIEEMISSYR
jgi:WD40 repeat protein